MKYTFQEEQKQSVMRGSMKILEIFQSNYYVASWNVRPDCCASHLQHLCLCSYFLRGKFSV